MKKLLIAANWKSNMTKFEAKKWLEDFSMYPIQEGVEVVVFAPFTLLEMISSYIKINDMPILLGAQDISPFGKGAYTGEISAEQIKEFATYVLIGHSERRSNFTESKDMINKKIEKAKEADLSMLVCVSDLDQVKSLSVSDLALAYEPIEAIGTGKPQDPNEAQSFVSQIKDILNTTVIYGGSVNSENVINYTGIDNISGVLVGSASLDAKSFVDIIKNAS